MLCLIFTKKKFIVGTVAKKPELLTKRNSKHLYLGAREGMNILHSELPNIIQSYQDLFRRNKLKVPDTIPVAVGIVKESIIEEGEEDWQHNIQEVLKDQASALELFYVDTLEEAFVNGLKEEPSDTHAPYAVVNALDDYITISFNQLNGKLKKLDYKEVMAFKELSFEQGYQHILNELISKFNSAGLILNETDKSELYQQIQSFSSHTPFSVVKNGSEVKITAEVSMSSDEFNELLIKNRIQLRPFLSREKVDSLGIQQVLLLGALADNKIMQSYLQQDLSLGEKVIPTEGLVKENPFFIIIKGLHTKGMEILKKMEEELQRKKQEEERQRRRAIETQAAKDSLMNEIRSMCKIPEKKEEYVAIYVEKGKELGLPREVIVWNIEEALKIAKLTPNAVSNDHAVYQSTISNLPATTERGIIRTKDSVIVKEHELKFINQLFNIKGVLPDNEFQTKKAYSSKEKTMKVLRVISTENARKPEVYERFMKLYNKELKYYGELSDITTAKDGKFYAREHLERITLKEYIKKIGLYNKIRFEDLNSSDLKFIFQVLKEVNDLQVSHCSLNEDNIIVLPKKKWGFTKEIELMFIGFTSKDCSKEEMEKQIHNMWGRLIGTKVYKEFRQKFNI